MKSEQFESRIDELREEFLERGLDSFLVLNVESSDAANLRYLTGFPCSLGALVITENKTTFLTDSRYLEAAQTQAHYSEIQKLGQDPLQDLAEILNDRKLNRIGLNEATTTLKLYNNLESNLEQSELVPLEDPLTELRAVKNSEELELQQQAAEMADQAFDHLLETVQLGMTEKELALELEFFIRTRGADDVAFDPTVASGPNSALPHATPSDKQLREGELLLLDIGARYQGYCSDLTRTVCLGEPEELALKVYDLVLEAQRAGLSALEPGVEGSDVDQRAREVISEAGYGEMFGHGLGHGVGLLVHENPRLSQNSSSVLEPHMVVTVEPGIYIPEWGGVRIEDMVKVTEDGCESFSRAPKEQLINPL
ncbi:MAG: M24 family metallopeptidase [Candidatus Bipolaricaulota bacterium]